MADKQLFKIGEAARIYHLSLGILRHYEKEGLLAPEYTDPETGYRYYSTRQFEVLNTIRYLRMLDLPLADIKEYMQNRKIPVIEEKLRHQKALIQQKKRELELIERKIDHRLQHIEDAKDSVLDQISLVSPRFPAAENVSRPGISDPPPAGETAGCAGLSRQGRHRDSQRKAGTEMLFPV